jgi:hypothetical protein
MIGTLSAPPPAGSAGPGAGPAGWPGAGPGPAVSDSLSPSQAAGPAGPQLASSWGTGRAGTVRARHGSAGWAERERDFLPQ